MKIIVLALIIHLKVITQASKYTNRGYFRGYSGEKAFKGTNYISMHKIYIFLVLY